MQFIKSDASMPAACTSNIKQNRTINWASWLERPGNNAKVVRSSHGPNSISAVCFAFSLSEIKFLFFGISLRNCLNLSTANTQKRLSRNEFMIATLPNANACSCPHLRDVNVNAEHSNSELTLRHNHRLCFIKYNIMNNNLH